MITLQQAIQSFILAGKAEGKSPVTSASYEAQLRGFQWFAGREGWGDIAEITPNHIREFLVYLRENTHRFNSQNGRANQPVNSTTLRDYYRVLSSMFQWLIREGILDESPMDRVKVPRAERKVVEALSSAQVGQLLAACGRDYVGVRNRAIISVLVDCGLRLGELLSLRMADIDLESQTLRVEGKTGQRKARFGSATSNALRDYLAIRNGPDDGKLWLIRKGTPLKASAFQTDVQRLSAKVGFHVHPHLLRQAFATLYLRNGGDVLMLQRLLGHTTLSMTERYVQAVTVEDALDSHKRFGPMDNLT